MEVSLIEFLDKPEHYLGLLLEKQNDDDTIEIYSFDGKYHLYLSRKNPNSNSVNTCESKIDLNIMNQIQNLNDKIEKLENEIIDYKASLSAIRDILYTSNGLRNIP